MNILDAIKSGKRFRRAHTNVWMTPADLGQGRIFNLNAGEICDDWEIEEESVTVTRSQAVEAAAALMKGMSIRGQHPDTSSFLKALGFKE